MLVCTICGEAYLPANRWQEEWCPDCRQNFRASDELRIRGEIEPTSLVLSPREVQALVAYQAWVRRWREEDADDAL